jgi:hypothetical protein
VAEGQYANWSFMQVESARHVVFQPQAEFQPLYEVIARTAAHVIKAEHIATFLGHKPPAPTRASSATEFLSPRWSSASTLYSLPW